MTSPSAASAAARASPGDATLAPPAPLPPLTKRVAALQVLYEQVALTRMAGIPILHPGLVVQAEGFEPESSGRAALGVLLTPWFMNLVRLPLVADEPIAAAGVTAARAVGDVKLDFIGAFDEGFGHYEACSLFSPMFEFVDQAAALATARAVLAELRKPKEPPASRAQPVALAPTAGEDAPQASRRALLFGRRAAPPEAPR